MSIPFTLIAVAVILAPSAFIASDAFSIVIDLEDDDGGMYSVGDIDPWEWGIPGSGTAEAPGPGRSWSGLRCWGSPLNGTYPNGTDSSLNIDLEIEDSQAVSISFYTWYDLSTLVERPMPDPAADSCSLEYSWDSQTWTALDSFTRTSGGDWVERSYEFPMPGPVPLRLRFRLMDRPDGRRGAGFFLDDLKIETIPFEDDVLKVSDIFVPDVIPVRRTFSVWCNVSLGSERVPARTTVELRALMNGSLLNVATHVLDRTGYTDVIISLRVDAVGDLTVELHKSISDRSTIVATRKVMVVDPVFHETFDGNGENWLFPAMEDPSFYPFPYPNARTPSGGKVAGIATAYYQDLSIGFTGEMGAYMQTAELDLRRASSAVMYVYHTYSFMGPTGTCGGFVMAHYNNEGRYIEPVRGYDSMLIDGLSGPVGSVMAFTGESGWAVDAFDLSVLRGRIGYITFQASSGQDGSGEGWLIDDVMVVADGQNPGDVTPPAPVTGLTYELQKGGAVSVRWGPSPEPDLDQYRLYISTEPITDLGALSPEVVLDPSAEPGYLLVGLEPSRRYHVSVAAVDVWGNMNQRTASITFIAPAASLNSPPVAIIRIEGTDDIIVGEEIVLSASGSYDPDGDTMTFTWTMPDGTVRIGERIRWTPYSSGKGRVMLQARDRWGATNETAITIDISDGGSSPIDKGNTLAFLILMVPIAIIMLLIIMFIAYLRSNRKRRLELDLEDVGIVHDPQYVTYERSERVPEATVLDLRPLKKASPSIPPSRLHREPIAGQDPPRVRKDKAHVDKHASKSQSRPHAAVNMTLECPSCMKKFRTRVEDPECGAATPIRCPHCGMQGSI